jgi:hypothetical protein
MEASTRPADPSAARILALVSGVVGLAAGLFLVGFFTLDPLAVRLAGVSLGTVNDILGVVQFASLAPVAWVLGRRLPASRTVRVATGVAVIAMIALAVLGVLLVARVLTFAQQIGPVMATIVASYGWLLTVNLVGHRTRTLPRAVSRTGVLLGAALLVGLVFVGAGYILPGVAGQLAQYLGWALGGIGWLGLPLYALLLAARVFRRSDPTHGPAPTTPVQGVRS